ALILAAGLALMGETDPAPHAPHATALHLLGLIVGALAVPRAGAVTAALLRRRIAAALFALATAPTALALHLLRPPAPLLAARRRGPGLRRRLPRLVLRGLVGPPPGRAPRRTGLVRTRAPRPACTAPPRGWAIMVDRGRNDARDHRHPRGPRHAPRGRDRRLGR